MYWSVWGVIGEYWEVFEGMEKCGKLWVRYSKSLEEENFPGF